MTNSWKHWLGAITACLAAAGPVWSQGPRSTPTPYYVEAPGTFGTGSNEGAVLLGSPSGSIYESGPVRPVQNVVDPEQVFQEMPPGGGGDFVMPNEAPMFAGDESVGFASMEPLDQVLFRVSNTSFDRLGIPNGYTSFDAFIPISLEGDYGLWFVNPRGSVTNVGNGAGSLGFGRRIYNASEDRVYGASFWWDWDTAHVGDYHQLGGSFESIGRFFSLRSNFVLPIGDANEDLGIVSDLSNPTFSGSNIVYTQTRRVENAYQQFDFELASPMPLLGEYGVDVGVGGYYLNGDGNARDGAGFSLRTQAQVTEDFWINGLLTTDPVFGANYSMNMELTIPNGVPSQWFARKTVASNLTASVLRNYRVAAKISEQDTLIPFTSPKGGRALGVAIIDPNATAGGTGTFVDPFASLAEYMALPAADRSLYDIVFVRAEDNGLDTNLNTTITLLNGQQLIGDGSGTATFTALESPGTAFLLPGQTVGDAPILSNSAVPGADVVTLASANYVTGFTIDGTSTGRGIVGTGIDGFDIRNNTLVNVVDGIVITSNTAPVLNCPGENVGIISGNTITGTGTTNPIDPGGIVLTHSAGAMTYRMTGNNVTGFNQFGADIKVTGGTLNTNDTVAGNIIGGNTFNNNGGGLRVTATGSGTINADIQGNVANNNLGNGFEIVADGAASNFNIETFTGNSATGNAGHGVQMRAVNGGNLKLNDGTDGGAALAGSFTGNLLDGFNITADNSNLLIDQIFGLTLTGNGDDGLELAALNGGSIIVTAPMLNNNFSTNGASVPGLGNPSPADVGAGRGNGLEVTTTGAGSLIALGGVDPNFDGGIGTLAQANSNTFNDNTGNGMAFELNGGDITVDGIYNNNATGNGANGISIVNNLGGQLTVQNADNPTAGDIRGNNFSDNFGAGMFIGGTGAGGGARAETDLGLIADNQFNRTTRGVEGILFNAVDNFIVMDLVKNEFIGRLPNIVNGDPGAGRGIGGRISGTVGTLPPGGLDLTMVDTDGSLVNTFTNNGDAHVGIIFDGGTSSVVRIDGHTFNNAFDGANTDFNGEGVSYIVRGGATLGGFIRSSTLTGNNADGILLETVGGFINDFSIGGPAIGDGNTISRNGTGGPFFNILGEQNFHGIHLSRRDSGQFNNLLIQRNTITENGVTAAGFNGSFSNGILMESAGSDQLGLANGQPDTVQIIQNLLTGNLGDGIEFRVEGDADIQADVIGNDISGNGFLPSGVQVNDAANGIQVTENVNTGSDTRSVWGLWQQNTITDNANDGIQLDGDVGDTLTGARLVIGSPTVNALGVYDPLGNIITDNGGDGVQMTMGGAVTIGNNTIMRNGTIDGAFGLINAGINIDGNFGNHSTQDVEVISNLIAENIGDGIEWLEEGQSVDSIDPTRLFVQNNIIQLNQGRGIDLLIRPGDNDNTDSDDLDPSSPAVTGLATTFVAADVTLIHNDVIANDLEGIYVVGTNSTDQSQSVSSSATLLQNGGVFPAYNLRLDIHDNDIVGNGEQSTFPATGLVIRVGSTDGAFGPTFAGGFATDGTNAEDLNNDGILDNDLNGDGFLNAAENLFGGISASVTSNYFDGNNGDDILIHSFASTVDPNTGTAWDAMTYNPAGYQSDPLSRLDLIFTDNSFGAIRANNNILSIVPGGQAGAFYNSADATFKSRVQGMNPEDGPFQAGTRRRNAQRLASRYSTNIDLLPNPSIPPASATFLYPGMGDSTFRVIGGLNTFQDPGIGVVTLDQIFIFDQPDFVGDLNLVDATFEASGVGFTGAQFGELPFGWGTFNPGRTGVTNP